MEKQIKDPKECCSARNVLWNLTFIGFAVNYMIRTNLNMAIVSMVKSAPKNNTLSSECFVQNIPLNLSETNFSDHAILRTLSENSSTPQWQISKSGHVSQTFSWNEKEQSQILGAFFWLHWLTQVPGGVLGSKYGAKLVFGLSNFAGVICCFFIPMAAYAGHTQLMLLRIMQGLLCGFAWPAMHNMTARWIPPNERSKFVTAYLGSSIGIVLTYPISGMIIHRWGWELVFYVSGIMGTLWFIAWCFLVYDSPSVHPRISQEEKQYILNSLGQTYVTKKEPVPWVKIATSVPVWMNIVAQWGGIWGLFTLMTHGPTYFKFIHGQDIRTTGMLSAIGHLLRTIMSYFSGIAGDYLLKSNKMNRTNVRKLATAVCTIGQGIFMLALAYTGCNNLLAVIFLSTAVALNGSVSTGPLACIVDISPNYASVILGFVNSVVAMAGFATPVVVGYLTYQNQTVHQWQKMFWISSLMLFTSGILYVLFAKATLQDWNSPRSKKKEEAELLSIKNGEEKK